jgi:hypothetical protein
MDSLSRTALGLPQPEIIYVDNCCAVSSFYKRVYPNLSSDINPFEPLEVSMETVSKIKVKSANDSAALYAYTSPIIVLIKNLPEGQRLKISVDAEWDTIARGQVIQKDGKLCVIQISYRNERGKLKIQLRNR